MKILWFILALPVFLLMAFGIYLIGGYIIFCLSQGEWKEPLQVFGLTAALIVCPYAVFKLFEPK
ncbi:MAG: hypothetical protein HQ579_08100 [Candidatus Omnitrophica bacterium]|nr:hypothetical protein [Candidatus Omnitrophota bacterium]